MDFKERHIETTGDIPAFHEIIEMGLVLCHPETLEVLDTLDIKIKPSRIENALPKALDRNGYKEENWVDAVDLKEAMQIYSNKTKDAVFYAYNVTFDWGFINEAFRQTGVDNKMDYHRFDIMSMVFAKYKKEMNGVSLNDASAIFGIPGEAFPHNALNGAKQALKVLKKL
jgi:DNA polymerase III alpha subunit (gram-positive type)